MDVALLERDGEAFSRAIALEYYQHQAGLKPTLDLQPIYDSFRHLFTERTLQDLERAPVEPKARRFLQDFVVTESLEARVRDLTEKLAAAEAAATVVWDGERLPYRRAPMVWSQEPDPERRRRLNALWRQELTRFQPLRERRHRILVEEAANLGFGDYVACYDTLRGLNLASLSEQARRFLSATADVYHDTLGGFLSRLGLRRGDAWKCDLGYLFRGVEFDLLFPSDELLPSLLGTLKEMGLQLDDRVDLDDEPRPLKTPRAACFPVEIPGDVRLILAPVGGRLDYETLFHEAGHALHYANVDGTLPFAYRRLGDTSVTETYAFLFQYLTMDLRWLTRRLRLSQPTEYLRLATFQKLYMVRRYATKVLYEQELHRSENPEAAARRYRELFADHLGVEYPREEYLSDVDDGFYSAQYLRAWAFEAQLRSYLREDFDEEWYRLPKVGRFLVELWREGQRYTVEELARFIGAEGLDLGPLQEELLDALGR
jgi:hypothetical protein